MELHLFWNGHSILFPIPFASPSLRLGQQGTRSLSPPCSSKGLRGGTCNSSWDHTQSHSSVTRVQQCSLWDPLTMNQANMALAPPLAGQKAGLPAKEGHFPHSDGKPKDDFLPHPFLSCSKFPFKQFHLKRNEKILSLFAQHNVGSFTQHGTGNREQPCEQLCPTTPGFCGIRPPQQPTAGQRQNKSHQITAIMPQNTQRAMEKYGHEEPKRDCNRAPQIPTSLWELICGIPQHILLWINSSLHRQYCRNFCRVCNKADKVIYSSLGFFWLFFLSHKRKKCVWWEVLD